VIKMLRMKTFKKFGISKDPFSGDVVKADDVYLTDDTRFVAEYLMQAARAGGHGCPGGREREREDHRPPLRR
jgi:hypothetical protein